MKHIEELSKEQIINIAKSLDKLHITEKLDGSALSIGVDDKGFYTKRPYKTSPKIYHHEDYPPTPTNNGFRAAHQVLDSIKGGLSKLQAIKDGYEIPIEVLYGRQPNAIVYGENHIVFFNDIHITGSLCSDTPEVTADVETLDLITVTQDVRWKISYVPQIQAKPLQLSNNLTISSMKEQLLNHLVRRLKPTFRTSDVESHEDFGVEGVVIKDPDSDLEVKLVDKTRFTVINQFNYAFRNSIKSTGPRFNPHKKQELFQYFHAFGVNFKTCVYNDMLNKITEIADLPKGMGKYSTITRTLKKLTKEEFIAHFDSFVDNRTTIEYGVIEYIHELKFNVDIFKWAWNQRYKLYLNDGAHLKYTPEIFLRSIVYAAEVRAELRNMVKNIRSATTSYEIAYAIYGKQMESAFPNL